MGNPTVTSTKLPTHKESQQTCKIIFWNALLGTVPILFQQKQDWESNLRPRVDCFKIKLRPCQDHVFQEYVFQEYVFQEYVSLEHDLLRPCLWSPYLSRPCLSRPCLSSPCLSRPCLSRPCLSRPCLSRPCLSRHVC